VPLTNRHSTIFLLLAKPVVWHLNPKSIYVGKESFPLAVTDAGAGHCSHPGEITFVNLQRN
jgi:hypothetical protein